MQNSLSLSLPPNPHLPPPSFPSNSSSSTQIQALAAHHQRCRQILVYLSAPWPCTRCNPPALLHGTWSDRIFSYPIQVPPYPRAQLPVLHLRTTESQQKESVTSIAALVGSLSLGPHVRLGHTPPSTSKSTYFLTRDRLTTYY